MNTGLGSRARVDRTGSGFAAAGTTVVHAAAFFFLFGAAHEPEPMPEVYAVKLIAAPEIPEVRRPEAVRRQADPPPPPPTPEVQEAPPEEVTPPPPEPEVEKEPLPESATDVELAPDEEPSTGDDVATLDSPGIDFQFPGYLRNIVSQIYRRWQKPRSNAPLRAEIQFLIRRDGSIGPNSIRFLQRSGNFAFDLNAQGAIEAAGAVNGFGPLPDGYANDILPVVFFFDPTGLRVGNQ